jgi:hypothetical protein
VRSRVRQQELETKVGPLREERDQIVLNIELINKNLDVLKVVRGQGVNEREMIEEDLIGSNQTTMELIY